MRNQFSTKVGIIACLAGLALFGFYLSDYTEDYTLLSRQAFVAQEPDGQYQENNDGDDDRCPQSSKLRTPRLVINPNLVREQSQEKLDMLKQFTVPNYEKFMMDAPGREHYTLFHWLTQTYHPREEDCRRHVVDIGTRYAASALALGATGVPIKSFDIPTSKERIQAYRGKSEEEWQRQVQKAGVQIEFYNLDLLSVGDAEFREYMSTWLIVLDTFHKPFSVPFEREFLNRLLEMEPRFEGILILDDINHNNEMRTWWQEIQTTADSRGYVAYDLTSIGHNSGTALLDFSRKVVVEK